MHHLFYQNFYLDFDKLPEDLTLTWYLEAYLSTQNASATAYARLYNVTDAEAITNSEVTTTSTNIGRQRSSALGNMPSYGDGVKEFKVEGKISNATYEAYLQRANLICHINIP